MASFDSYLDIDVESIEKPRAPPVGHYFAEVAGWKTAEKNFGEGKANTPVVEITFRITAADEDVDAAELDGMTIAGKLVSRDYTLNEESGKSALRTLTEVTCGADVKGLSLRDALNGIKGLPVKLALSQRAGKEEGQFFPKVDKVLKAD